MNDDLKIKIWIICFIVWFLGVFIILTLFGSHTIMSQECAVIIEGDGKQYVSCSMPTFYKEYNHPKFMKFIHDFLNDPNKPKEIDRDCQVCIENDEKDTCSPRIMKDNVCIGNCICNAYVREEE